MRCRLAYGLLLLVGLFVALLLWFHPWPRPRVLTGPVVHVVDGDTIDVRLDDRKVRVRDIGVNTPETKPPIKGQEPCGPEASAANRRLVAGQTVRQELDIQPWDRYRRLLAYVYVGGLLVNAELVRRLCPGGDVPAERQVCRSLSATPAGRAPGRSLVLEGALVNGGPPCLNDMTGSAG
jgi:hypothetical protein